MLTSLGHWAVRGGNHEDGAVHLRGTRDHVFHIVSVSWAVDVCVVTIFGFVFDVGCVDGDTAGLFFRSGVDLIIFFRLGEAFLSEGVGDGRGERSFAVIDVTDGPDVHVRLVPGEVFFSHVVWMGW